MSRSVVTAVPVVELGCLSTFASAHGQSPQRTMPKQ
jgi:hypothetical protein